MKIIAKIWNNFITGFAVLLPLVVTIFILRFLVAKINQFFLEPLIKFLRPYILSPYLILGFKAIVFFLIITVVILIGMAARSIAIRRFFAFGERFFLKAPLVGKIYKTTREVSKAFFGEGKTIFKKVVLIEYPRKNLYSIGFLTEEMFGEIAQKTGKELVNVFVPTAPNPTSGVYLLVPKEEITFLDMSVEDGFKLIISAGAVIPSKG